MSSSSAWRRVSPRVSRRHWWRVSSTTIPASRNSGPPQLSAGQRPSSRLRPSSRSLAMSRCPACLALLSVMGWTTHTTSGGRKSAAPCRPLRMTERGGCKEHRLGGRRARIAKWAYNVRQGPVGRKRQAQCHTPAGHLAPAVPAPSPSLRFETHATQHSPDAQANRPASMWLARRSGARPRPQAP